MRDIVYIFSEFNDSGLSEASRELFFLAGRLFPAAAITAFAGYHKKGDLETIPAANVYALNSYDDYFPHEWGAQAALLPLPRLFLIPMSPDGMAFAASYAAASALPLNSGVVSLEIISSAENGGGALRVRRFACAGAAMEETELSFPQVLLLHPGLWGSAPLPSCDKPSLRLLEGENRGGNRLETTSLYTASWREMELEEGAIVISGGAGMGSRENFNALYALGEALNAPVGGSRIAEDRGWVEKRQMIGATGRAVEPEAYICWGVSGAIQHCMGIRGAERIVAVNNDAAAAIFHEADLAVCGDAGEIIPLFGQMLEDYILSGSKSR
jgi:electron transfer flavoprotein alpha subunit